MLKDKKKKLLFNHSKKLNYDSRIKPTTKILNNLISLNNIKKLDNNFSFDLGVRVQKLIHFSILSGKYKQNINLEDND